jgi:hypothetical protein
MLRQDGLSTKEYRSIMPNLWLLYGTKSFLTSWYFPLGLRMSIVHCHVHSSLLLCQLNPIHYLTHHFFKVDCNTIVSSTVVTPKLSLPKIRFQTETSTEFLISIRVQHILPTSSSTCWCPVEYNSKYKRESEISDKFHVCSTTGYIALQSQIRF